MEKKKNSYKLSLVPEEEVNVVTSRRRRPRFHEKNEKSTSSSLSYAPTIQSSYTMFSVLYKGQTTNTTTARNILFVFFLITWISMLHVNFFIYEVKQEMGGQEEKNKSIELSEKKMWCVIQPDLMGKSAMIFGHFPHSMEHILPCWSGFIERGAVVESSKAVNDNGTYQYQSNCGFFLILPGYTQNAPLYVMEVLEAMGCEVIFGNSTFNNPNQLPESDDYFRTNLYLREPRYEYIRYANEPYHLHILRRRFVSDEFIKTKKGGEKPLQIGLMQRTQSRRIVNLKEVQVQLEKNLPESNITYSEFNYVKVKDQAEWFATKDMIIGAHGAAMINSMFITPKTIVMQMYPPGWFWNSMEPLVEQAGGIAIQWYQKGIDPLVQHQTNIGLRNKGKMSNFSVPVDDIVAHVMFALGKWPANIHHLDKLKGK